MTESINTDSPKVRENRLRRAADRQGLRLEKSRQRDPRATLYGTYHLVDEGTNALAVWGSQGGYGLSLDEIEDALNTPREPVTMELSRPVEVGPGVYKPLGDCAAADIGAAAAILEKRAAGHAAKAEEYRRMAEERRRQGHQAD
jgi:hypothetical protein